MVEGRLEGEGVDVPPEVPEADLLEQRTPVVPDPAGDEGGYSEDPEADEADRWEQQQPVLLGEDDYPPDPGQDE